MTVNAQRVRFPTAPPVIQNPATPSGLPNTQLPAIPQGAGPLNSPFQPGTGFANPGISGTGFPNNGFPNNGFPQTPSAPVLVPGSPVQFAPIILPNNGAPNFQNGAPNFQNRAPVFPQGQIPPSPFNTPNFGNTAPNFPAAPQPTQTTPPNFDGFAAPQGQILAPNFGNPQAPQNFQNNAPIGQTGPLFPAADPSRQPNYLYQNQNSSGFNFPSLNLPQFGNSQNSPFQQGRYLRVIQNWRFSYTWIYGEERNQVGVNDLEFGFTLNVPNFLRTGSPLQISPGFILHYWDGPQGFLNQCVHPPAFVDFADLPSRAYSGFVDFDYSTPVDRPIGADLNFSVGLYSDFNSVSSDSVRFKGHALARIQVNPRSTFRVGAAYLDRLDVKLLPAFGWFYTPNADWNVELYFPSPKISRRIPQYSAFNLWSYVRAEYGGDSWTFESTAGISDQVDLNDYRIAFGIETLDYRGLRGQLELGYVFKRELVYRNSPLTDNLNLEDSLMIRLGLTF